MPVQNYWTWTKTTPRKKRFFWSNPLKFKVMITFLIQMLELPNFGHMTTSIVQFESCDKFLDIAKFAHSWWKNADVSRAQRVCRVIHIFLALLWVRYKCAKFHNCRICVKGLRKGGLFAPPPPIREQPRKSPSWIGLITF